MSIRRRALSLSALLWTGCATVEGVTDVWSGGIAYLTPPPAERDFTEESEEEWKLVGSEIRPGQAVEKDPDQWWRRHVMSEKAREIEANLGFE